MRILLDTHAWLWMLADEERLGGWRERMADPGTELLLSAASIWEIVLKEGTGKLDLPGPPETVVPEMMRETVVTPLPILPTHALRVASLPFHHHDPFNRLLVAQAQLEDVPILTADGTLEAYEVEVLRL